MAEWIYACDCSEIEEEDLIRWDYEDRTFAIYNIKEGFFCTDGMCTHEAEHLEYGMVIDDIIECPLHQGRFRITSGEALTPPVCVNLKTFPVKVENEKIYIGL